MNMHAPKPSENEYSNLENLNAVNMLETNNYQSQSEQSSNSMNIPMPSQNDISNLEDSNAVNMIETEDTLAKPYIKKRKTRIRKLAFNFLNYVRE